MLVLCVYTFVFISMKIQLFGFRRAYLLNAKITVVYSNSHKLTINPNVHLIREFFSFRQLFPMNTVYLVPHKKIIIIINTVYLAL